MCSSIRSSQEEALLRPLESGYRGVDYDFITAETKESETPKTRTRQSAHAVIQTTTKSFGA
jgi:hypothetical protein